jgi:hypothetical protein
MAARMTRILRMIADKNQLQGFFPFLPIIPFHLSLEKKPGTDEHYLRTNFIIFAIYFEENL